MEFVRNDTRPVLSGAVDFDLSGYTVELHIDFPTVLTKTAVILTSTSESSTFEFTFTDGDLSPAVGKYKYEIQFDDGSGGIVTYNKNSDGAWLKLTLTEEIA